MRCHEMAEKLLVATAFDSRHQEREIRVSECMTLSMRTFPSDEWFTGIPDDGFIFFDVVLELGPEKVALPGELEPSQIETLIGYLEELQVALAGPAPEVEFCRCDVCTGRKAAA
jgi:hypothetical protein